MINNEQQEVARAVDLDLIAQGVRMITPRLGYPLGEDPITIGGVSGADYSALTVVDGRGGYVVAAGTGGGDIKMALFSTTRNMLTGDWGRSYRHDWTTWREMLPKYLGEMT